MVCKLNKPIACFNCPYDECIDTSVGVSKEETEFLKASRIDYMGYISSASLNGKTSRSAYYAKKYAELSESQKERKRKKSREYYRQHQKELTEKRKQYFHDYWLKRKAAERERI